VTESPFSHVEDIKPAIAPDNASVAVADMFSASTVETPEVLDPIVNDSPNFEQPVEEVTVEEVLTTEVVEEVEETPAEEVDPVVAFASSLNLPIAGLGGTFLGEDPCYCSGGARQCAWGRSFGRP
jgi:hypothetical protein